MNVVTLGLSKILGKKGEPTKGDFNEEGYTAYGLTYEDTAEMMQADPEEQEFYAEEEDDPVDSIEKAGKITFKFSIMNPSVELLERLYGGEVVEDIFGYPDLVATIEESVIIVPRKGLKFQVPRMKLTARINGKFSKKGLLLIDVVGTIRKPKTSGLKKMYVKRVA